jgi:nitrate/TMAO reductase-like tetraheme cytochrome c subunit
VSVLTSPLAALEIGFAVLSATLLVAYLVFRPPLVRATKIWLLFGLGVFPIGAAFAGNVQGFEATKERAFCGSCHVMALHQADSDDRASGSLASRHARNAMFGNENCYVCHADYGMFGTVVTKAGGLRHVWYYLTEYRTIPVEEAKKTIHLREPAKMSGNCIQCHSTEDALWLKVPDHQASVGDVRAGRISCASAGCHGLAHPFFQAPDAGSAVGEAR